MPRPITQKLYSISNGTAVYTVWETSHDAAWNAACDQCELMPGEYIVSRILTDAAGSPLRDAAGNPKISTWAKRVKA